ncbi:hypothetical protein DUNSADRAFT_9085 [Dunaliella salina]|uniref:Uncharacterized protein n=1 Tax=Dunaliella salina TaxID=3046 RepID=A0ABQ7H5J8_DUNSA|nr:hypothetical protein DUNSADRAFT_9085 [Dunaliella salina]|eukprot:KAF5842127.1 hypothetical protein DUNSADRAFT_9085 [Dunaliella salina]
MGLSWSSSRPKPITKKVLVPPMFQRDGVQARLRDRFVESSYPYLGGHKRDIYGLFQDFMLPSPTCSVLFSPPADRRFTVAALVGLQQSEMVLRFQPLGAHVAHTFVDWQGNSKRPGDATLRASVFDPASGWGMFGTFPCAKRVSGTLAQVGARYSSRSFTAGAIAQPRTESLNTVWMACRYGGLLGVVEWEPKASLSDISSTLHRLRAAESPVPEGSMRMLHQQSKIALAYEPIFNTPAGQGHFSACIELRNAQSLAVSFYQHMAVSRRVFNPTETKDVVGITNYIDLGMEIVIPTVHSESSSLQPPQQRTKLSSRGGQPSLSSRVPRNARPARNQSAPQEGASAALGGVQQGQHHTEGTVQGQDHTGEPEQEQHHTESAQHGGGEGEPASVNLAAAWQLNKNWMMKARVGSESVAAAVAARNWHTVSVIGTLNASWKYGDSKGPRLGAHIQLENFGALRYERGVSEASGRAVLQRHEAEAQDIANMEGTGLQVCVSQALQA